MKNVVLAALIALGLAVSFAGCQKKEEAPAAVEANETNATDANATDANATEANATEANATEANATK